MYTRNNKISLIFEVFINDPECFTNSACVLQVVKYEQKQLSARQDNSTRLSTNSRQGPLQQLYKYPCDCPCHPMYLSQHDSDDAAKGSADSMKVNKL